VKPDCNLQVGADHFPSTGSFFGFTADRPVDGWTALFQASEIAIS
jgi:hypothetical protein